VESVALTSDVPDMAVQILLLSHFGGQCLLEHRDIILLGQAPFG